MSDMVERVARAIVRECEPGNDKKLPQWALRCARAAIAAMREPTEAMVKALLVNGPTADTVRMHREAIVRDWKIMVDAAMP